MTGLWVPLAAGDAVIERFSAHGPLAAAFLVNLLATVGDKGQLVVVTLASRYDARSVFVGSMAAFTLWSALEVVFGQWLVSVLPEGTITPLTGGLFLAFGLWTLASAVRRSGRAPDALAVDATALGLTGRSLDAALAPVRGRGPVVASFAFILLAEFGDKTQLLTINLAATFPGAPVAVFVGVVLALGLRTGVDAVIGAQLERALPTRHLEAVAGVVFAAFGAHVFGLLSGWELLAVVVATVVGALAVVLWARYHGD